MSKKINVKALKGPKNKKTEIIIGTMSKHKRGFGFVTPEIERGGDIFISQGGIGGAMNGDLVQVKILEKNGGQGEKEQGVVDKILKRSLVEIIGTFEKSSRFGFVVPDDKKLNDDIFILKKDFAGAKKGDKVVASITRYPDSENNAEGKITEIISRRGEPGGDIKALIRQYNLFDTFPSRVNAEAKAMSKRNISPQDEEGRTDLRNKHVITIDGADAKDLDDGVSAEKLENGNYLLGVHIADVSHYVEEDGPLDKEALKRGNSVYLIDKVIPMLPKPLSNGICSLNPEEDRLTLSVDMEITPMGQVVNHRIYESMIHSKARMVYTDVSDILENRATDLISKYCEIYDDLLLMDELAGILRKKREDRGSLDFDFDEAYITLDSAGIPVSVDIAERRRANKMIEEFMLAANETVAEHFHWLELPFVYRVHERPALDKMEEFKTFLRGFGVNLRGDSENIHPKALNEILDQVKGKAYENVVNTVMLRSMKKAFYDVECGGHFGLSLKYYCHFTSPIRRYPDLIIHRIIKENLKVPMDQKRIKAVKKKAAEAAEAASLTERKALELEREVEKLKKAEFMSYHVGETHEGIISGVTNYGLYVELENTIEGMVRLEYLNDDYYDYDSAHYRVIGRRTNKIYALGDKVSVKVHSVIIEDKEINFIITE